MSSENLNSMRTMRGNFCGGTEGLADAVTMPADGHATGRAGGARLREGDELLSRYTVLGILGEGGMGIVYKCFDKVGGVNVAIKGLPPEVSHATDDMESIRENFQLVVKLRHPNICGVRTLEKDADGNYYLVMDLAEGVSLSRWLRRHPGATDSEKTKILAAIASALDYAHSRRVIHRDVKCENVMIDDAGNIQVLDFGLAAQIKSTLSKTSTAITSKSGSPGYKAPEQWMGRAQSTASDQYSLGVVAYYLFSGHLPFEGDDLVVLGHAVLSAPIEPVSGLSTHMNAALAKALSKNPEERFGSCSEFVAALEGKIKVKPPKKKPSEGGGGGAGKVAAAIVALALVGAGGYYAYVKHSGNVAESTEPEQVDEVYVLKGKASQAREKNAKEEWLNWPHFDVRARELEGYYRAGEAALDKGNYAAARRLFVKVRENWQWLSSNKVERVKADNMRKLAESALEAARNDKADAFDAARWAQVVARLEESKQAFDRGEFASSAAIYDEAAAAFATLAEDARKDAARRRAEAEAIATAEAEAAAARHREESTRAALAAFNDSPPRHAEGFRLAQDADQSNKEIQFYLGVCYDFGYGVAKDDAKATEWYMKSAEQGDMAAQYNLGNQYANGYGIAKDEAKAVEWYRKAAEQGYASAQRNLGNMYKNGCGVAQNYLEAVNWYRKAAEQGNAFAQNDLGIMYATGKGVPKDEAMAVEWYRKSAENGNAVAQSNLGLRYESGEGVAKNLAEAVKWYRKAAEQNDARGQFNLGDMYEHGKGVQKDVAKAFELYLKSAEQGYVSAQYRTALMYDNGTGVAENNYKAVEWYRKAAENGNANAQNNLGVMYENGEGVAKDLSEAVKWYRMAVDQNNDSGQFNLGDMYEYGKGVAKDEAKAFELYLKAAEQGHVTAQYRTALMYDNGTGVAVNDSKAIEWYRKAAENGHANAQNNLGVMYENGEGIAKDLAEAVKWYRKAADQNSPSGQFNLGGVYEHGKGVAKDISEARRWYEKAAAQGHESATKALERLNSSTPSYSSNPTSRSSSLSDFFPVSGITLGKTRLRDIVAMGGKSEGENANKYADYIDLYWWDHNQDGIVEQIYTTHTETMPKEWVAMGMNWGMSYNEWLKFFRDRGFSTKIEKAPCTEKYSGRNTLSANFIATAYDGSISFDLNFNYGNYKHEGYSINSRNSLYGITITANP